MEALPILYARQSQQLTEATTQIEKLPAELDFFRPHFNFTRNHLGPHLGIFSNGVGFFYVGLSMFTAAGSWTVTTSNWTDPQTHWPLNPPVKQPLVGLCFSATSSPFNWFERADSERLLMRFGSGARFIYCALWQLEPLLSELSGALQHYFNQYSEADQTANITALENFCSAVLDLAESKN